MLGVAMYFACFDNQYVGPIVAHLDALRALDRAFGLEKQLGTPQMDNVLRLVCSEDDTVQILVVTFPQPLAFLLYLTDKTSGPKIVLLLNASVTSPLHPFPNHDVIQWARLVATG